MGLRTRLRQRARHLRSATLRSRRPQGDRFWTRYRAMPGRAAEFLNSCSVDLREQRVAVLGCGDGAVCLGLYRALRPSVMVGYDTTAPTATGLETLANAAGVRASIPPNLRFEAYVPEGIPSPDDSFDAAVVAASPLDFGDLARPIAEAVRVVTSKGVLVVALSRDWPARFAEVVADVSVRPEVSLDEVQAAVLAGGWRPHAVQLDGKLTRLTDAQLRHPLASLAVGGVMLLAHPATGQALESQTTEP